MLLNSSLQGRQSERNCNFRTADERQETTGGSGACGRMPARAKEWQVRSALPARAPPEVALAKAAAAADFCGDENALALALVCSRISL